MDRDLLAVASGVMAILAGVAADYGVLGTASALGIVAIGLLSWFMFWEDLQ